MKKAPMAKLMESVLDLMKNRDKLAAQRDELRTVVRAAIAADPDSTAATILRSVDLEQDASV